MKRFGILVLGLLLIAAPAFGNECETAAKDAEQAHGLPPDLLVAIGRIETGRRGPDGRMAPWPWAVNAAGRGYYLNSLSEAVDLVRSLEASGVRSIDVGCFQINLMFHPNAFATLEEGFDPSANAQAAAAFLGELRGLVSGWEEAVGRYHSADPAFGLPYMRQVLASWRGGALMSSPPISQVAALVRVIVPQAFMARATMSSTAVAVTRVGVSAMRGSGARLPVVIVPSSSRL